VPLDEIVLTALDVCLNPFVNEGWVVVYFILIINKLRNNVAYIFLSCLFLFVMYSIVSCLLKVVEIVENSEWAPCLTHFLMLLTSKYM